MRRFFILSIVVGSLSANAVLEEEGVRRIGAHLLIEDFPSALLEAKALVELYPESIAAQKMYVQALSINGQEEEMLSIFKNLTLKHPDILYDRHLLEEIAWGVLKKGTFSTQYGVRLSATIGAYLTRDVRALPILVRMMRDSNAIIRAIAVQMAASLHDAPLKDEIVRLMKEERVWMVRLEVIKTAGIFRMKELTSSLQALVQSEKTTLEERQAAIGALLEIYESISLPELQTLARSSRAGLRHLACSIAAHFPMQGAKEEIFRLLQDTNPSVRIAALNAFGLFYHGKEEDLKQAVIDSDPAVAITAGWAAYRIGSPLGEKTLARYLQDPLAENRRLAAAALAATGSRGEALSRKMLKTSSDPYVKANLALGLLGQRIEVAECSDLLYAFLESEKRMWMLDKRPNPLFEILSPSQVRHNDQIPNYPEAQDLFTRLQIVSLLAIVEDPRALDALKTFLKRKHWGLSGFAASTLLHEGDETALAMVKQLLEEKDSKLRLQACLVLAHLGKDGSVLRELQGAYVGADHEEKLHILEAIGQIGNAESYSFLMAVLQEPFPILRLAAAAALIQSVNR